jgi:hypothetical protein
VKIAHPAAAAYGAEGRRKGERGKGVECEGGRQTDSAMSEKSQRVAMQMERRRGLGRGKRWR